MSLATMIAEMRGAVPNYSAMLARTHIREAWTDIRKMRGWSFQLGNSGFSAPSAVGNGTVTVTLGSATVTGDATASAAWATASTPVSLLTQRQFRIAFGTIYNILSVDFTIPTAATLTLDRPYIDQQTGSGLGYKIYQCYYPVPVDGFLAWESILDVGNVIWLNVSPTRRGREWADQWDPQRQIFMNPQAVLPYGPDTRTGSATFGRMMYELYPQPLSQYTYQSWYSWEGPDLVAGTDTLPYPMTEQVVKAYARVKAYEWAEANKDPANPRGAGADFRFLMGGALSEAKAWLKDVRGVDQDLVNMWQSTMSRISGLGPVSTFDPSTGTVMSRNM